MNAPLIVLARRDARCLSLPLRSPFNAIKKYAGRNNDRFIRNSAILADARRRAGSTDPPHLHARTHARSLVRSPTHSRATCATGLALGLIRTHARTPRRVSRAPVWVTRFVARVPTTTRSSRSLTAFRRTPRRHPRVSRYASLVPRSPPEWPPPRGLIASASRAAARFELPPPRCSSLSLFLFLCPPFACLPITARRLGVFLSPLPPLHLLLLRSFRRTRRAAVAVAASPLTFRARYETGRLKADGARGTPRSLSRAAPCNA